jgi:hypothetical protein
VVAIRRRDPAEAEKAMRNLLAGTISDLEPAYAKYPDGFPPPPVAKACPQDDAPHLITENKQCPLQRSLVSDVPMFLTSGWQLPGRLQKR